MLENFEWKAEKNKKKKHNLSNAKGKTCRITCNVQTLK